MVNKNTLSYWNPHLLKPGRYGYLGWGIYVDLHPQYHRVALDEIWRNDPELETLARVAAANAPFFPATTARRT